MKQLSGSTMKGTGGAIDPFDTNAWRMLQDAPSSDTSLDLNKYLSFTIERGSEDSAQIERFEFTAYVKEIRGDNFHISLEFTHPNDISIGTYKDILIVDIEDPDFFSSASSGSVIP